MDINLLIPKIIKKLFVCVKANLFSIITECQRCLVLVSCYLVIFYIGTYGEVWNCVQRETGAHRAVKVIKRYKYLKQQQPKKEKKKEEKSEKVEEPKPKQISGNEDPMNEIKLLCELDHPNIVRVHETFKDDEHYYIVLEYLIRI